MERKYRFVDKDRIFNQIVDNKKCNNLYQFAIDFRRGIEQALNENEFHIDIPFQQFPIGCCGDASILLGHYLLARGIETNYVCGSFRREDYQVYQTHAWLETEDGSIIDITGDQFKDAAHFFYYNIPVYVGKKDDFHNLFEIGPNDVKRSVPLDRISCLDENRLPNLYRTITKYI